MSTETLSTDHAGDEDHHDHPSDAQYVKIAIILAVLTAIEVATYWFEDSFNWGPILVLLMVVKGIIVAGYFMHLKFDDKLLTRIFVAGFILACAVYVIALSAFRFWDNSGLRDDYGENVRSTPYVANEAEEIEAAEDHGSDDHGSDEDHGSEEE